MSLQQLSAGSGSLALSFVGHSSTIQDYRLADLYSYALIPATSLLYGTWEVDRLHNGLGLLRFRNARYFLGLELHLFFLTAVHSPLGQHVPDHRGYRCLLDDLPY